MLEATPGAPWGIGFKDLLDVESDMRWRFVLHRPWIIDHKADPSLDGRSQRST